MNQALLDMAEALDQSARLGADKDQPEGARYIQISDTLARRWAARLRNGGQPGPDELVTGGNGQTTYSHNFILFLIRDLRNMMLEAADELDDEPLVTVGVRNARCALARGLRLTAHIDLDG